MTMEVIPTKKRRDGASLHLPMLIVSVGFTVRMASACMTIGLRPQRSRRAQGNGLKASVDLDVGLISPRLFGTAARILSELANRLDLCLFPAHRRAPVVHTLVRYDLRAVGLCLYYWRA